MRLEYVAGRVVAFLLVRASFEFLRVWRKHQKAIPPISAFKNEEGEAIEFEDRRETYRPDTQMERLLGEARPFEVALVEQESARIFGSGPKTAQLEAYLVQLCLLHPDVLAGLGVPDEVFVRLNEIEATDRRRKVTKGSRAAAETESGVADAVQATTIGKFLNIVKNTALDRVEKFELFLRDDLRKACDAAGADFPIVCRHLLATAIRHGYPVPAPQADTSEVECA